MAEDKTVVEVASNDKGASVLGLTLNILYASVGIVSAIIYGKQAYDGVKTRISK